MPHYRCYLRDASGTLVKAEGFDCGDDEEAKLLAVALSESEDGADLELWQSGRWVFSHTPRAATGKVDARGPGRSDLRTILVADDDPELRDAAVPAISSPSCSSSAPMAASSSVPT